MSFQTGPFEIDFTKRGVKSAQRGSGIQDETRSKNKLPLGITFQTGFVKRAAQIYCARLFGMTFHVESISLSGGCEARGAARESKTKEGPRMSSRSKLLPNGVREARSTDPLCRAIRNDDPFEMDFIKRALRGARGAARESKTKQGPRISFRSKLGKPIYAKTCHGWEWLCSNSVSTQPRCGQPQ